MSIDIPHPSLNIAEPSYRDDSIESWQYYDYEPQSQNNLNSYGTSIQIDINSNDIYTNPAKSYITIKGQIKRENNNAVFDVADEITLVNNAMMFLFSEVKYSIGSTIMERVNNPGQTSSMLGYLSLPDDFSTSSGLMMCWSKDTTVNANSSEFSPSQAAPAAGYTPTRNAEYNQGFAARKGLLNSANPRGSFSCIIPLDHMFGFAEYDKVIYGVKHSLTLARNSNDMLSLFRAGAANGKIDLKSITWRMPQVKPSFVKLGELREIIQSKVEIPVYYRARTSESTSVPQSQQFSWRLSVTGGVEKPRWIIVGFQTDKNTAQTQNPAIFDHLDLSNAYVTLNSERYPMTDITTNFASNDYTQLYEMFDSFKKEYYGYNSLVGGTQVNFSAYKSLFPIIVFDVRRQSERLKSGVVDIQLKFFFSTPVPANTFAYATTISDRQYSMKSDGTNMTMISY